MNGITCELDSSPNATTLLSLNAITNTNALINGYNVDDKLYSLSRMQIDMKSDDFGITILMMHFAQFYSRGQYPLFVNQFRCVRELEMLEKYLLTYNQNHIKLPINMATHREYGLLAQKHKFVKNNAITCHAFNDVNLTMRNSNIQPIQFIDMIKNMHINIIESFYIFTSITKNCKIVQECHELMHKCLNYTFVKPVKTLTFDGDYWFILPPRAIWFAYHNERVKVSYISSDTYKLMDVFKTNNIRCVVVGFIHDNQLYPIIFEDPSILGNWASTIQLIKTYNFNCVFNSHSAALVPNLYFVKNSYHNIFKYVKKL